MYLLYATEEEAIARAELEGKTKNLGYYRYGYGTKYLSYPAITKAPLIGSAKYALEVSDYTLTEDEEAATVESVTFPSLGAELPDVSEPIE